VAALPHEVEDAPRRTDADDVEHDRVRTIFLTEVGQNKLESVRALAGGLQREFFQALTAEERRTLHALLLKLAGVPR
jgi:DNA-binding MarR family transcriptional regulator